MILPFAKLGTLALKTLSKPLASAIRSRATSHPKFREYIINFAQNYHKMNVNLQRRLYGHATNVDIKPLNEERAVTTAADLVGELIIFGVGGSIVIFEVSRSAYSEARKEEARRQERESLRLKDIELEKKVVELENRIFEIEKNLDVKGFSSWLPSMNILGTSKPETTKELRSRSDLSGSKSNEAENINNNAPPQSEKDKSNPGIDPSKNPNASYGTNLNANVTLGVQFPNVGEKFDGESIDNEPRMYSSPRE